LASTIISNNNSEEPIEKCLTSVQDQNCPSTEVALVDNFHSNGTLETVNKTGSKTIQRAPFPKQNAGSCVKVITLEK